jgi:mRNA-degrading endonuclease RelE of RelBE toxin-antitoxin system
MFKFDLSEDLEKTIALLAKKNSSLADQLKKKMKQIIESDDFTIDHYKNLRNELSDRKRVHVGENYVLTFKVNKQENKITFLEFEHRDKVYLHIIF